jgi:hypothetical protein
MKWEDRPIWESNSWHAAKGGARGKAYTFRGTTPKALTNRAVCHHHTYGYGMAIIQYGFHTIGSFSRHLMVWLQYRIMLY